MWVALVWVPALLIPVEVSPAVMGLGFGAVVGACPAAGVESAWLRPLALCVSALAGAGVTMSEAPALIVDWPAWWAGSEVGACPAAGVVLA